MNEACACDCVQVTNLFSSLVAGGTWHPDVP